MSDASARAVSPFHAGEKQVQARMGVRDIEELAGAFLRTYMPEQHRVFHTAQPFLVAAARDSRGRPWATLLAGADGFVTSPDPRTLVIDAQPGPGDALEGALNEGSDIGILGIDLATRRRNRANGRIKEKGSGAIACAVVQTFGNCSQYIREREWRRVKGAAVGTPRRTRHLTPAQRAWIGSADTFFIASGHRRANESPVFGMDASHRGGEPGFVQVTGPTRLVFPDYAGNNYFNTIGNLVVSPRAGLLFVDFPTGSLLQLTGKASVAWDSQAVARVPGARRLVNVDIEEVVELPGAVPLRWDADAASVRSLRLIEKVRESTDVTSFVFEARDGGPLPAFKAGQYLPIELAVQGLDAPVRRTFTLSGAPGDGCYRISVKRRPLGGASRHLHDHLEVGATMDARKPEGDFVLPPGESPVVLVSAGVGVTPMVSMLHALAEKGGTRRVWFIHGARDGDHHPFAREVRTLAATHSNFGVHVAYSQPRTEDRADPAYDSEGRVDGRLVARFTGSQDAHYFLCGPARFMADVLSDLERRGVPAERIHTESFGPEG